MVTVLLTFRSLRHAFCSVLVQLLPSPTRYYAFFDDVDVTSWVSIDNTTVNYLMKNRYSRYPPSIPVVLVSRCLTTSVP